MKSAIRRCHVDVANQGGHTSLKVLEKNFFPVFQDLESLGKQYGSLKVLEFDASGP